jgi:hypothetical protein
MRRRGDERTVDALTLSFSPRRRVSRSPRRFFPPCFSAKAFCIFALVWKIALALWPRLFINKRRTRKAPFGAFDIQDQSDFVFPQKSLDTPRVAAEPFR